MSPASSRRRVPVRQPSGRHRELDGAREQFPRPPDPPLGLLRAVMHFVDITHVSEAFEWEEHRHGFLEVLIAERGTYHATIDDQAVAVPEGHLLVVQVGERHRDRLAAGTAYRSVGFSVHRSGLGLVEQVIVPGRPLAHRVVRAPAEAIALHDGLLRHARSPGLLGAALLDGMTLALYALVVRCLPADLLVPGLGEVDADAEFRAGLERIFAAHISAPLAVTQMARALNLGTTAFTAQCRSLLGAPPATLFRRYRLERARNLLRHTTLPIGHIAQQLGFATTQHFDRLFRSQFKKTPRQMRESRQDIAG